MLSTFGTTVATTVILTATKAMRVWLIKNTVYKMCFLKTLLEDLKVKVGYNLFFNVVHNILVYYNHKHVFTN